MMWWWLAGAGYLAGWVTITVWAGYARQHDAARDLPWGAAEYREARSVALLWPAAIPLLLLFGALDWVADEIAANDPTIRSRRLADNIARLEHELDMEDPQP